MKKFYMKDEEFICDNCHKQVTKLNYTARDHCPHCLWSRHVDNNPGDRQSDCGGMMRPIGVETKNSEYIIIHKCEKCGKEIRQKSSENDDINEIIAISSNSDFIFGN